MTGTVDGGYRTVRLRGPLDRDALRRGLDRLVERHQILRTTFRDGERGGVHIVHPPGPAAFESADLRHLPAGDRLAEAMRMAAATVTAPFDLGRGPLLRALLITLDTEDQLFVLAMHRAIADDRSFAVVLDQLAAQYAGTGAGPAPAPPAQYADYVRWQSERLTPALRDSRLAYWREAMHDVPRAVQLPSDHVRPRTATGRAASIERTLSEPLSAALGELATRTGVSLSTVLLTAFTTVLHRHSGQGRFAIGWAVTGRDRPDVEAVPGPFADAVAVPVDLSAAGTVAAAMRRTDAAVRAALEHRDVPFADVVAALDVPRDPSRHPVFQVLFQYGRAGERWTLPGLRASAVRLAVDTTTPVDLLLVATDGPGPVVLTLSFARDLYRVDSAERLLDAVRHVLAELTAGPDRPLRELSVLPDGERRLVVREWNETTMPYPADTCLHELFEQQATRAPEAAAVIDAAGVAVSYARLDARANQLAHHLRGLGVGPEYFVGICIDHSVEMLVGLLAILKAGGAYVPLDPEHPADRLSYLLADTAAGVVVTLDRLRKVLPASFQGHVLSLDTEWAEISGNPDTPVDSGVSAQNLVYAMYTSGSTGRPKGVLISHRGLVNYLWWAIEGYGLAAGSGAPMVGSIAFDLSVPNFFLPLIGGKTVRLLPVDDWVESLSALLAEPGDFSLLKITPGHLDVLRGLLREGEVDSVGTFVVGADEVRPETVAGWQRIAPNARIINEYGPTETVVGCSVYPIGERFDPSAPVPIGKPIGNLRMYVLDEWLQPVPVGVAGELYIGGDGVARGYLNRPGLTADRFLPDPFAPRPGARFYRSGDLARWRADGDLEFLGRIDHQVKISGYRIELGEIEARLLAHPRVSEAVVVARPAPSGQKRLVAYLVLTPGGSGERAPRPRPRPVVTGPGTPARPGSGEFAEWLAHTLPAYMIPTQFVVLDRMPLTEAGKVDRAALPEPVRPAGRKPSPTTKPNRS